MMAVLVLAALLAALSPGPTSAFYYVPASGTIGSVTVRPISVLDMVPGCATTYGGFRICPTALTLAADTGPTVYRSPAATGRQIVQAIYTVEQWTSAGWTPIASSDVIRAEIGANQTGVQLVRPVLTLSNVARGYFRFTWIFSWFSSAGVNVGSTAILSNLATDHVCVTPLRWCQSYDGYVRTGGYLTNSW